MKRPVALLTGAAGLCGRRLAARLAPTHTVVGVGLRAQAGPWSSFHALDLREADRVRALVAEVRPDCVFHLAGRLRGEAAALLEHNALTTIHLCEALLALRPEARLLVAGSSAEYGVEGSPFTEASPCRPETPYGISKLASTLSALGFHQRRGLKVLVARPTNIVGVGMSEDLLVGSLVHQVAEGLRRGLPLVVRLGNTYPRRDLIDVEDVTQAYLRLAQCETWGAVYNLSSGRCPSVLELVEVLEAFAGQPIRIEQEAARIRPGETERLEFSHDAATLDWGFAPAVPWEDALRALWDHALFLPSEPRP